MRSFLACALCLSGFVFLPQLQAQSQPPKDSNVIHMTTQEVVLDVVVRDKKGHPVTDLVPNEVQVLEDGTVQKVHTFRLISGREQEEAETAAAKAQPVQDGAVPAANSLREVDYVSIVFGPMDLHNLTFARDAVRQFLKDNVLPNTYVTIYRIDRRLRLVQPYTRDLAALNRAADAASQAHFTATTDFASTALRGQPVALANSAQTNGSPLDTQSLEPNDPLFRRYASTMDASTNTGLAIAAQADVENQIRYGTDYTSGMYTTDSLKALIHAQAKFQGRKVVIYMSDGLALPPGRPDVFERLVSDANRIGVTFYTIDTRGLSVISPTVTTSEAVNQRLNDGAAGGALNTRGGMNDSSAFNAMRTSDDMEAVAVSDAQASMAELAAKTGGFATANTNVISGPMRRVLQDIRTHYELAYTPESKTYDGHFRNVQVVVNRPGVKVQSRKGYYALPELNGEPIQQYELTALNAVNARPLSSSLPYWSEMLQFRTSPSEAQCQVAFDVPISSLSFAADSKTGKSRLRAALVGFVQDANGQIISNISREIDRDVPTAQVAAITSQRIEYVEPVELAPGHYTLSTALLDENTNRTSVRRLSEFVNPANGPVVSSVALVKRLDPLANGRNPRNPFETDKQRVVPSLDDSVSAQKPVPFYFVAYPDPPASNGVPKLTVQVFQNGKLMVRSNPDIPAPDASGAVPVLAELNLKPGAYSVIVTLQQGAHAAQTSKSFVVN